MTGQPLDALHDGVTIGVAPQHLQMLAKVLGVKPDRMIIRYVADALAVSPRTVARAFAVAVVTELLTA